MMNYWQVCFCWCPRSCHHACYLRRWRQGFFFLKFERVKLYLSSQSSVLVQTNLNPPCLWLYSLNTVTRQLCCTACWLYTRCTWFTCVYFDKDCGMLLDETPLFDPALLQDLDWSSNTISFSPSICPSNPGDGLVLRPLCIADFKRGESEEGQSLRILMDIKKTFIGNLFAFPPLLQDFIRFYLSLQRRAMLQQSSSQVGHHFFSLLFLHTLWTKYGFALNYCVSWPPEKFEHMKKTGDYYVAVIEDTNAGQVVATATLIIEHKFIHSCAKVNPHSSKQYTWWQ